MKKIPIKIVELTSPSGKTAKEVMLDVYDYYEIEGAQQKLNEFKKQYFQIVNDAEKLFYGKKINEKKKYQNLPSSVYWKLCILLNNFNKKIENEFEITNYIEAISRDFGLSKDYIYDMLTIVKIFNKNEIIDSAKNAAQKAISELLQPNIIMSYIEKELASVSSIQIENQIKSMFGYVLRNIDDENPDPRYRNFLALIIEIVGKSFPDIFYTTLKSVDPDKANDIDKNGFIQRFRKGMEYLLNLETRKEEAIDFVKTFQILEEKDMIQFVQKESTVKKKR